MNKAKALFATGIIVIVAGVSAVCLYLNNSGKLSFGKDGDAVDNSEIVQDEDYGDNAENNGSHSENGDNDSADGYTEADGNNIKTEDEAPEDGDKVDITAVNEFLSTFSRLYFCENSEYSEDDPDMYELLKFAYLYAETSENGECTQTEFFNDDIGFYNGIKAEDAKRIIEKFFGISIEYESVYTEQDYQFFMYRDGYFYTPAADGVGYVDLSVTDSAVKSGDTISVVFTVYSDGVTCDMTSGQAKENGTVHASGKAEIRITSDGYKLIDYSVKA